MSDRGLVEVPNPSALFLAERRGKSPAPRCSPASRAPGRCWSRCRRWSRPSLLGTPRRAVVGWDGDRLAMMPRCSKRAAGCRLGANDVYLNIAGGLRIVEPAADLAVAAALVSPLTESRFRPTRWFSARSGSPARCARSATAEARLNEAAKLGFAEAWDGAKRPAAGSGRASRRRTGAACRSGI